jgi:hypothetical protein
MNTYYVVCAGPDRFDLRQTRYRALLEAGREHPHDLMAAGFTAEGMREILAKWFSDTDSSALPLPASRLGGEVDIPEELK